MLSIDQGLQITVICLQLHGYNICGTILLYSEDSKGGGGFLAGFLIGGAIFGTLGYVLAPQVLPKLQSILH